MYLVAMHGIMKCVWYCCYGWHNGLCSHLVNVLLCTVYCIPYEWYIWRTLSSAVWEGKQIGGHLVWQISLFIIRIKTWDKTPVLVVILIWWSELNPRTAKCTAYTVVVNATYFAYLFSLTLPNTCMFTSILPVESFIPWYISNQIESRVLLQRTECIIT